uniref:F-box domain-containing protein n=1 Tax=Meloidogyne enterolobii TaxID=390850 RepID=A0A6V7VXZ0_MELEN|nr:unnamed protein product [Meloidogyne enterolobii]
MNSLPIEAKLDVLKCLDFNQLFSFKQTNFYFLNLINKYKEELALIKFSYLSIIDEDRELTSYEIIEIESGIFDISLNDNILKKWQAAIDKSIPLFLHNFESNKKFIVCLEKKLWFGVDNINPRYHFLNLPNIPKNIEEMIVIRCWLEQLFSCSFDYAVLYHVVFNPEMIDLLFDNDKTIPTQFHLQSPVLIAGNNLFEDVFNFALNHLSISSFIKISLNEVNISEQHIDILFNILVNEGKKLSQIRLEGSKLMKLHDLIIKYVTTSIDCSKVVDFIALDHVPNFKLGEKRKKFEITKFGVFEVTSYEVANIYNPQVRFSSENVRNLTFIKRIY